MFFKKIFGDITAEELKHLIDNDEKFYLIDVRSPAEFKAGHIPKSVNIPITSIENEIENEVPQKDSTVVLYCASGTRSLAVARYMKSLGYTDVKNLGGISKWKYGLR